MDTMTRIAMDLVVLYTRLYSNSSLKSLHLLHHWHPSKAKCETELQTSLQRNMEMMLLKPEICSGQKASSWKPRKNKSVGTSTWSTEPSKQRASKRFRQAHANKPPFETQNREKQVCCCSLQPPGVCCSPIYVVAKKPGSLASQAGPHKGQGTSEAPSKKAADISSA